MVLFMNIVDVHKEIEKESVDGLLKRDGVELQLQFMFQLSSS